jgi:hypothetical protein
MNNKHQNIPQSSSSKGAERPDAVRLEENIAQHVEKLQRIREQMMELRTTLPDKMDRIFNAQDWDKYQLKKE